MKTRILILLLLITGPLVWSQQSIDWTVLHREWYINSAGYPSDDAALDKLYFKLHDFKLDLSDNQKYTMTFRKDSVVTGTYVVNKEHLYITFTNAGKSETYGLLEMNQDVLSIMGDENKTWLFLLNLTSHK